jgi:hypothetical protein
MSNKSRYSSIEKRFAMFLAKFAPRLKEDVGRAFTQWNNIVCDHLRAETGLRLTVGNESQAVPVHIEDGLPKAFAQAIESSDEETWALLMHRGVLRETAKGMRFLRREFEQVSAWLALEPTPAQYFEGRQLEVLSLFKSPRGDHKPAQYAEVRHVETLLYTMLRRLRSQLSQAELFITPELSGRPQVAVRRAKQLIGEQPESNFRVRPSDQSCLPRFPEPRFGTAITRKGR